MESNILNDWAIESYLGGFCDDRRTAELLAACLGRALRKGPDGLQRLTTLPESAPGSLAQKFAEGAAVYQFVPDASLDLRVRYVANWIKAAVKDDEDWLYRCDVPNRPEKLLLIDTLEAAEVEADKAAIRRRGPLRRAPSTPK